MKKSIKCAVIGSLAGILVGSTLTISASTMVNAYRNDQIKVTLNGVEQTFRDATTNEVELPLTYNDRTYLPLRSLANLVGVNVDYNAETNTAILEKGNFYDQTYNSFEMFDYSNRLEDGLYGKNDGYIISKDGSTITIKGGDTDKVFTTNLSKKIKSFRCSLNSPGIIFWALTEDGELYFAKTAMSYDSSNMNFVFEKLLDYSGQYDSVGKYSDGVKDVVVVKRISNYSNLTTTSYDLLNELSVWKSVAK